MRAVALVVAVVTATYALAFRPEHAGTMGFFWLFGAPHLALAGYALYALGRDGTLASRLVPRAGDISIGALTAMVLLGASWAARSVLVPTGTGRMLWLLTLYAQLGDPEVMLRSVVLTVTLLVITLCEELVWRGLVLDRLNERLGTRLGWVAAAALYAFAALPTAYSLRVEGVGFNPLLIFAAFGCGVIWTFLAARLGRLLPSAISHAVFSYFSVVQFRWPF